MTHPVFCAVLQDCAKGHAVHFIAAALFPGPAAGRRRAGITVRRNLAQRLLGPSHRIAAREDAIDQRRDGGMMIAVAIVAGIIAVGRGGVAQDAKDFMLGQNIAVIEGQQQ